MPDLSQPDTAPSTGPADGAVSGAPATLAAQPQEGGLPMGTDTTTTAAAGGVLPRQASLWSDAWRNLRRNPFFLIGITILVVFTVMAIFPGLFTSTDPRATDLSVSQDRPGGDAWFGYDTQGHDYFSYVVHGARVSMVIGLVTVGGALLIGVVLGAVSGFYGGWLDTLIARITDVAFGLPLILGAILFVNFLANATGGRGVLQVSVALMVLTWMVPLRLLRSSVITVRDSDYVQAARAMGASDWRIITKHILPNAMAPVLVYSTISVGVIIAAEATLSFLGVGLQAPAISWGLMINAGQQYVTSAPHLLLFPGAFLAVAVLAFILIGDALRDALDPKLR